MVSDEARLVAERLDRQTATEVVAIRRAINSVLSKEGGTEFNKMIKQLSGET